MGTRQAHVCPPRLKSVPASCADDDAEQSQAATEKNEVCQVVRVLRQAVRAGLQGTMGMKVQGLPDKMF